MRSAVPMRSTRAGRYAAASAGRRVDEVRRGSSIAAIDPSPAGEPSPSCPARLARGRPVSRGRPLRAGLLRVLATPKGHGPRLASGVDFEASSRVTWRSTSMPPDVGSFLSLGGSSFGRPALPRGGVRRRRFISEPRPNGGTNKRHRRRLTGLGTRSNPQPEASTGGALAFLWDRGQFRASLATR
jgi:hypothetical protein